MKLTDDTKAWLLTLFAFVAGLVVAFAVTAGATGQEDWTEEMNQESYWEDRLQVDTCNKFNGHNGFIPSDYDYVVVKGGQWVVVYADVQAGTTVDGPIRPSNGREVDISWVMKCNTEVPETTTTTVPPTTTTTVVVPTTTEQSTTTTTLPPSSTTTTVPLSTTTEPPPDTTLTEPETGTVETYPECDVVTVVNGTSEPVFAGHFDVAEGTYTVPPGEALILGGNPGVRWFVKTDGPWPESKLAEGEYEECQAVVTDSSETPEDAPGAPELPRTGPEVIVDWFVTYWPSSGIMIFLVMALGAGLVAAGRRKETV